MSFSEVHPQIAKVWQSKGGKVKTAKGFAKMDKEEHLRVSALGGYAKRDNRNNKDKNEVRVSSSVHPHKLEEILTDIENNEQV